MVSTLGSCHSQWAMRILVVEDDDKLCRALERGLGQEGYAVDIARSGQDGLSCALTTDYDAIVLDVMLPGPDGFTVCRRLRAAERWVPLLFLTARAEVAERIRGLDEGADDYLVKPFDLGELLARLRVLVQRGPAPRAQVRQVGGLGMDAATSTVTRAGRRIALTAREYEVLEVLARVPGRLVARVELVSQVWHDVPTSANIADVYVGQLRRKLELPGAQPLIRTVRGRGFVLEPG